MAAANLCGFYGGAATICAAGAANGVALLMSTIQARTGAGFEGCRRTPARLP